MLFAMIYFYAKLDVYGTPELVGAPPPKPPAGVTGPKGFRPSNEESCK